MIWLPLTFFQLPTSKLSSKDPRSNKNLPNVPYIRYIRSEMGRRSFSFAIWNSPPQHIRSSDSLSICFPRFIQDLLISTVTSTIVINIVCTVSSDFDHRTWNRLLFLPCISHIALFLHNIWITVYMEKTPRCKKTSAKLTSIITWWCHVENKFQRVGTWARACDQKPCPLPPVFNT